MSKNSQEPHIPKKRPHQIRDRKPKKGMNHIDRMAYLDKKYEDNE